MEYMDPIALASVETPAPALSRGLAILRTLAVESPLSLEVLAARLKLPKASLFRLLETMQSVGCVRKTADKKYEPLWVLKPVSDLQTSFVDCLISSMKRLCKQTSCTIEWFEFSPEGMRMMRQELPDVEVCVKARPGVIFTWGIELSAVIQVGYAFAKKAPNLPVAALNIFKKNGVLAKISPASARKEILDVRKRGFGKDDAFNMNGVRRWAVPVMRDDQLLGILSIAESFRFNHPDQSNRYLSLLREALNQLQTQ